jgi:hypothetical protein
MRRDHLFWGSALILLGILFLLQTQNIIPNIWPYLWPLAMLLAGVWLILGVYWKPAPSASDFFDIALGGAKSVSYKFTHGAGQIEITGGAPTGKALVGSESAGLNRKSRMVEDKLEVRVEAGASFIPFVGPESGIWKFQLTNEVPITLKVETGASTLNLDLRNVIASAVKLETGASTANVVLPSTGASSLDLEAGAATVNILIPEGVSGRIRIEEGATSLNVDTDRFPSLNPRLYQSQDFETAANHVEINIEAGLGSITIK